MASTTPTESQRERLRALPSVERLAAAVGGPPRVAVAATRAELARHRRQVIELDLEPPTWEELLEAVRLRAEAVRTGSLRPVINATGVILHTNLGRAPLAPEAAEAAAEIASGYSNLELDLDSGDRGSRHEHLRDLLCDLSGAESAIAVNNNAGAVLLALAALAEGGEVVIGRDQLIEIGDSFRIPEILSSSGAVLIEVGTTNRTRSADYERAIGPRTAALMRVHQSNFRTVGFSETVAIEELCDLAREHRLPVIDDLGSGAAEPIGDEPVLAASVAAGAVLVCASADKLLGGPQAGMILGRAEAVERCRRHPLARALRIDKLQLAALEATLRVRRDHGPEAVPTAAMLAASEDELATRAGRLVGGIGEPALLARATSRPGGGSLPTATLEGPVCRIESPASGPSPERIQQRLRSGETPVIARISDGAVVLDPRTIRDRDCQTVIDAVRKALG